VFLDILGLALSLAVLTVAGDQFVIGVGRVASAMRMRPTVVGALVGGFGTSIPELIVAGVASAHGDAQIAMGSAVGSIIANVALGLAVAALVAPVRVDSRTIRREAPVSVAAVVVFAAAGLGGLSRLEGFALAGAFAIALVGLLLNVRSAPKTDELAVEARDFFDQPAGRPARLEVVRTLVSLAAMVGGAEVMVQAASSLSRRLGIEQGFVGLTLVAIGTSAPLIAAAIQAARRGDHDLVVGNVLGCNLFIALLGGPIIAFIQPGPAGDVGVVSLILMAGLCLASWAFMARGSFVRRSEAVVLLVAYAATLPFVSR